jgi:hypothetical protein
MQFVTPYEKQKGTELVRTYDCEDNQDPTGHGY